MKTSIKEQFKKIYVDKAPDNTEGKTLLTKTYGYIEELESKVAELTPPKNH